MKQQLVMLMEIRFCLDKAKTYQRRDHFTSKKVKRESEKPIDNETIDRTIIFMKGRRYGSI
jgi:hypothetical protein